jgi:hypothetical protein
MSGRRLENGYGRKLVAKRAGPSTEAAMVRVSAPVRSNAARNENIVNAGIAGEYAEAAHAGVLLRPRHQRPCGGTGDKADKLPSLYLPLKRPPPAVATMPSENPIRHLLQRTNL